MIAKGAPRHLWDDCLEPAYIHSYSVNSAYHLDGSIPKTYMSGETEDIGKFYEMTCMCHPGTVDYPDESLHLGKYLGPTIDVGLAITAKLLQNNGEVLYQGTYELLTIEEWGDHTVSQDMVTFKETIEEHLGAKFACHELEEVSMPDMPEYIPYADECQNKITFPNLVKKSHLNQVMNKYMHISRLQVEFR